MGFVTLALIDPSWKSEDSDYPDSSDANVANEKPVFAIEKPSKYKFATSRHN